MYYIISCVRVVEQVKPRTPANAEVVSSILVKSRIFLLLIASVAESVRT